jgi:hypothetical protein
MVKLIMIALLATMTCQAQFITPPMAMGLTSTGATINYVINYSPALNNGGFESLGGTLFTGWSRDANGASTIADTSDCVEGGHAVRLNKVDGWCYYICPSSVIAGKHYNVDLWAKSRNGTEMLAMQFGDGEFGTSMGQTIPSAWTNMTRSNVASNGTKFQLWVMSTTGTIIVDKIRVIQLD